jgi:DNA-binding response OmpR family regulator
MTHTPDVLLVAPTPQVAAGTRTRLIDAGMKVTVVETFGDAREQLHDTHPDLLISEVRLGAYNGLHLALRAQSSGIPAIILGQDDPVMEREAKRLGATYVEAADDQHRLAAAIRGTGIAVPSHFGRRIHAA